MEPVKSARCPSCEWDVRVKKNGELYKHPCNPVDPSAVSTMRAVMEAAPPVSPGLMTAPEPDPFTTATAVNGSGSADGTLYGKGPWFGAQFPGECERCLNRFEEGDRIRADGEGSYECEAWCGQDDDFVGAPGCPNCGRSGVHTCKGPTVAVTLPAPADPRAADGGTLEVPDPFTTATPTEPPEDEKVVRGLYQVTDPETGDYRRYKNGNIHGWTRATTFNKAAQNTKALRDWGLRNVVIGMSKEPALGVRAAGLTHEDDRQALDDIAEEASKLAGAKVAADTGTAIHKLLERLDGGEIVLDDIENKTYRMMAEKYLECLAENGLVPVLSLIEGTTLTKEYGGVCGRFDRIYFHEPSGTYVMGDVKSGKTMKYAKNETEVQLLVYVLGYNRWGTYDWVDKVWSPPAIRVRDDWGVVIHMPVQGDDQFTVTARRADLASGRAHAEVCYQVRSRGGGDMKPLGDVLMPVTPPAPAADPAPLTDVADYIRDHGTGPNWELLFASVRSQEEAAGLYDRAVGAGVVDPELGILVNLAMLTLQTLSQG